MSFSDPGSRCNVRDPGLGSFLVAAVAAVAPTPWVARQHACAPITLTCRGALQADHCPHTASMQPSPQGC
eukprot:8646078-Alexandrium_andersonii.AAC.1